MGFSSQEYGSRLPFPPPGDLLDPGVEPGSPALKADSLSSEPPGKPTASHMHIEMHTRDRNSSSAYVCGVPVDRLQRESGFPGGSVGKESACNAGDAGGMGLFPGWGRPPEGGHGNPLQCSCLENPIDRGAWRAAVHGVTKSRTRLSNHTAHTECTRVPSSPHSRQHLVFPVFANSHSNS